MEKKGRSTDLRLRTNNLPGQCCLSLTPKQTVFFHSLKLKIFSEEKHYLDILKIFGKPQRSVGFDGAFRHKISIRN